MDKSGLRDSRKEHSSAADSDKLSAIEKEHIVKAPRYEGALWGMDPVISPGKVLKMKVKQGH